MHGNNDLKIDQNILVNGNSLFDLSESMQYFKLPDIADYEDKKDALKDKQKLSMIFRRWASADNLLYEFFEVEYEPNSVSFFEPKCSFHYKCRRKT